MAVGAREGKVTGRDGCGRLGCGRFHVGDQRVEEEGAVMSRGPLCLGKHKG